jgi:dipeptide transport system permease protein
MLRFFVTKLTLLIPTFIGVTFLTFFMIRLIPGDPIELLVGERGIDPARHAHMRAELGLDRPLHEQYAIYVGNVLQGDLGKSIVTKKPVLTEFLTLFPATMPIFWWGLLLIILFSVNLHWTPVSGRISLVYFFQPVTGFMLIDSLLSGQKGAFWSAAHHLVLPAIVLGTIPLAVIARMTRSSMLEVLSEDYIRTARAKGLSPLRVVNVHALRNALIPVITVIGLQVGTLLAGAILTETIFSWPGIGRWLIESVRRRDYPSLQGGVLLVATTIVFVNLTVDLLYGLINPRIRHAR